MFKNPFSFEGRIRRTEFGLSLLLMYVGMFFIGMISGLIEFEGIIIIFMIPTVWFMLAQGAKRCHDRGNSGWYQIIPFYDLWMLFGDGDHGVNEYGQNPKGIGNSETI